MKKLIEALTKYIIQCDKDKETHTFRGLIAFLKDEKIDLEYIEAQCLGLLDFNNALFDLIEGCKQLKDLKKADETN